MPGTDHASSKSQKVNLLFLMSQQQLSSRINLMSYFLLFCVFMKECPPLGMESHRMESDQLSASSVSQYRFAPQRARLNMQVLNYNIPQDCPAWS